MTRRGAAPTPVAAPVAQTVPSLTLEQIAALRAGLTAEQRKALREIEKDQRAKDPSKGEMAFAWGEDGLLQLDLKPADIASRKTTGDGRQYLFNIDSANIKGPDGRVWKLSAIYATEVR